MAHSPLGRIADTSFRFQIKREREDHIVDYRLTVQSYGERSRQSARLIWTRNQHRPKEKVSKPVPPQIPMNIVAPQLILLPGLATDAEMWQAQLAAVPPKWNAAVTDVHTRHHSIEDMAQALLDEHPGPLVLCGASMGGMVAMEVARRAGPRLRGLALLGTSARPETEAMRTLREGVIPLFEQGRMAEVLRANIPLAFAPAQARNPALAQRYMAMVMRSGAAQLVRQNRAIMVRPDARQHLASVSCPVLLLCGESDKLTPPEHTYEIAGLLPQAEVHILPGCGHMLTLEQPSVVNTVLLEWLLRLS
jgi:pimeloyl-ACP methyl ester carboxylesterase